MIAALLCLALAAPTTDRVLVLDVQGEGVDAAVPLVVRDTVVSQLQTSAALDVVSAEDMRRVVGIEAEKQAMGCKADASCLAELAGALGARFLVYGSAARLSDVVVVNLSLFDSTRGVAVARESLEISDVGTLPRLVRGAVKRMFATEGVVLVVADEEGEGVSAVVVAAGAVSVASAFVSAGCAILAVVAEGDVKTKTSFVDKQSAAAARDGFIIGALVAGGVTFAGAATTAALVLSE